jgi:hypothetical protein
VSAKPELLPNGRLPEVERWSGQRGVASSVATVGYISLLPSAIERIHLHGGHLLRSVERKRQHRDVS